MAEEVSAEDSFLLQDGFGPQVIHPLVIGWGLNKLHKHTSESQPAETAIVTQESLMASPHVHEWMWIAVKSKARHNASWFLYSHSLHSQQSGINVYLKKKEPVSIEVYFSFQWRIKFWELSMIEAGCGSYSWRLHMILGTKKETSELGW